MDDHNIILQDSILQAPPLVLRRLTSSPTQSKSTQSPTEFNCIDHGDIIIRRDVWLRYLTVHIRNCRWYRYIYIYIYIYEDISYIHWSLLSCIECQIHPIWNNWHERRSSYIHSSLLWESPHQSCPDLWFWSHLWFDKSLTSYSFIFGGQPLEQPNFQLYLSLWNKYIAQIVTRVAIINKKICAKDVNT